MFLYQNFDVFFFFFDLMSEFFLLESGGREKKVMNVSKQTNKKKPTKNVLAPDFHISVITGEREGEAPKCMWNIRNNKENMIYILYF